jgi:hypothetical protein
VRLKIKDMTVNLAQDFAEYSQTCGLFAGACQDLAGAFRNLRKGVGLKTFVSWLQNPRTRVQKSIANRWLEYQYGLKPLMQDIHELIVGPLANIGPEDYRMRTVSAGSTKTFTKISKSGSGVYFNLSSEWYQYKFHTKARFSVIPGDLSWLSSYGFTNPAELVWELIPYSFVADWLFNVGDVLSGLDALVGVSLQAVQPTCYIKFIGTTSFGGLYLYSNAHRGAQHKDLQFGRVRYEPSQSYHAVLNGLALLTQMRR